MFRLIQILQPAWYFNLRPSVDHGYFPTRDQVEQWNADMKPDPVFSARAADAELAYRAHKLGFVQTPSEKGMDWWTSDPLPLQDEYRFARKYFHPVRVWYGFFMRLCLFNNPFKEFSALLQSRGIKRHHALPEVFSDQQKDRIRQTELQHHSRVTVIIPTLNRYRYLHDVLKDLELQTYRNFDVIVVDQSDPYDAVFYQQYQLELKVIRQEEKALWRARNTAINSTESSYLLFYDDDSRVNPDWIEVHLKGLQHFNADISSGVSLSATGAAIPASYSYFRWSDQLDTGNVMIRSTVFQKTGLFDRSFEKQRMGDGEFGLRSYLSGFRNISNPLAKRIHLKVGEGGLREMGHWDAFRSSGILTPRPVPSVLYLYRKYFGNRSAILSLFLHVPPSVIPYRFKRNRGWLLPGSLFSLLLTPLILIQVMRSWMKSTVMLKKAGTGILS